MKRFFCINLLLVLLILLCIGNVAIAEDDDEYTVTVDEDAQVRQSYPDNNYGTGNVLKVGWEQAAQGLFRSWLKFDLTSLSLPPGTTVASAQLQLYKYDQWGTEQFLEGVYYGSNDTWNEGNIDWNWNEEHFGSVSSTATDTVTPGPDDGWYTWDVTSHVKEAYEGDDKTLTFVLHLENEDLSEEEKAKNHLTFFASRENTSYGGPHLTVTATPEPASIFLFGAGLGGLAWYLRRRKKRRVK